MQALPDLFFIYVWKHVRTISVPNLYQNLVHTTSVQELDCCTLFVHTKDADVIPHPDEVRIFHVGAPAVEFRDGNIEALGSLPLNDLVRWTLMEALPVVSVICLGTIFVHFP